MLLLLRFYYLSLLLGYTHLFLKVFMVGVVTLGSTNYSCCFFWGESEAGWKRVWLTR